MNNNDPNKMTDEEFEAHNNYLNWFQPVHRLHRDYRFESGFRFKKVMYAYRRMNKGYQHSIRVTFHVHDFNCNSDDPNVFQNSNYVKVSPVVLPLIDAVERNRVQEITDFCKQNQVYGIFFFATRKPVDINIMAVNVFHSKLYVYTYESNQNPNINPVSIISAVYPVYNYRGPEYMVYLLFNHSRYYRNYHQNRLTRNETAHGVLEMSAQYAKDNIIYQFENLYRNRRYRYAAIYVEQFTTLTVFFENDNIVQSRRFRWRRGFPRRLCHERVLVQRGGLVGLMKYDLRYQFMDSPRIYNNLRELAQSNLIRPEDNTDMTNVENPLIVLGSPADTTNQPGMQAPFPSYGLRVQNTDQGDLRPATLLLPTGARILTVRDFYPDMFKRRDPTSSDGYRYVTQLWNAEPYKESTGPYADANGNISGNIRSAFINGFGSCLAPL